MKTDFRIVILLLSIALASCASNHSADSVEPASDVNKAITVIAPTQINTFKLNDFVRLAVRNNSDHEVLLSPESTVEITMMRDGQSISISNLRNASNSEVLLSSQTQKDTNQTLYNVIPNIEGKQTTAVRISIKGIDQTTNQEVSGYVDITLNP